jgi:hypothetical protein
MKKLTLSLDALTVESFDTAGSHARAAGTVHGNQRGGVYPIGDSAEDCGYNTEGPTCGAENTCGYYYETCAQPTEDACGVSDYCDTGLDC